MNITLRPDLEQRLAAKVERGAAGSVESLVEDAINLYLEYDEGEMDAEELRDTMSAIDEALSEEGPGQPAAEVFASLRRKHDLSR
jgi:hypothetical protein